MRKVGRIQKLIVIFSVFLITLIILGCQKEESAKEGPKIKPVKVSEAGFDDLAEALEYVGNIKAQDEVVVYPKVSGKITEKIKEEGSLISKGDTIAYIDRDEVGLKFQKAPVESPLSGVMARVYVDIGANVIPQTPVALVVNIDEVKVEINVAESDLPKVKVGQIAQVKVDAYPDAVFEGRVKRVSPVVDLVSRTALIEINIPNSEHKLKPGMFARVKVLIKKKENVLVIPRDAIIREDNSNYVFVVKSDSKAHKQKIELGLNENNKFEVISGVNQGELVVTMGNTRLKEGDTVEIVK